MRRDFQRMMKVRYSEMIEELTGRKVLAFLSQAHVEPDLTVEMFLMDGPLAGFGALELVDPATANSADGPTRTGSILRDCWHVYGSACARAQHSLGLSVGDREAYCGRLSVGGARGPRRVCPVARHLGWSRRSPMHAPRISSARLFEVRAQGAARGSIRR